MPVHDETLKTDDPKTPWEEDGKWWFDSSDFGLSEFDCYEAAWAAFFRWAEWRRAMDAN